MFVKVTDLHFLGGGSDKVYHAAIEQVPGGFMVQFAYGRRGSTLARGAKTTSPVTLEKAEQIHGKLIQEKVAKGYVSAPFVSGVVFSGASADQGAAVPQAVVPSAGKQKSGVLPQLLNDCTEDLVEQLIKDPAWGMQEKYNGERRMVRSGGNGPDNIEFINKLGFIIPPTPRIANSVGAIRAQIVLDGEGVADSLFVFGLLEYKGKNLGKMKYGDMHDFLEKEISRFSGDGVFVVSLARTESEKRALYQRVKESKGEGVVFKRLDAVCKPGRPASGGDHLKFKFWESASCIVTGVNDKRSVRLGVLAEDGSVTDIGNVTIPANKAIPKVDDIVEIKYLYAYRGGSLYQPQYLDPRTDVLREECVESKLKFFDECSVGLGAPGR